jgi:hypothetical protein
MLTYKTSIRAARRGDKFFRALLRERRAETKDASSIIIRSSISVNTPNRTHDRMQTRRPAPSTMKTTNMIRDQQLMAQMGQQALISHSYTRTLVSSRRRSSEIKGQDCDHRGMFQPHRKNREADASL